MYVHIDYGISCMSLCHVSECWTAKFAAQQREAWEHKYLPADVVWHSTAQAAVLLLLRERNGCHAHRRREGGGPAEFWLVLQCKQAKSCIQKVTCSVQCARTSSSDALSTWHDSPGQIGLVPLCLPLQSGLISARCSNFGLLPTVLCVLMEATSLGCDMQELEYSMLTNLINFIINVVWSIANAKIIGTESYISPPQHARFL